MPITDLELDHLIANLDNVSDLFFKIYDNIEMTDIGMFLHVDGRFSDEEYDEILSIVESL